MTEDLTRAEKIAREMPREYDLNDPAEHTRLVREVRGYLKTCHLKHGTDWEGRKFAIDALAEIVAKNEQKP